MELYPSKIHYVEDLIPDANVFGDRAFKKVIKGKCGYKVGPNSIELVSLEEEEGRYQTALPLPTHAPKQIPCEDAIR